MDNKPTDRPTETPDQGTDETPSLIDQMDAYVQMLLKLNEINTKVDEITEATKTKRRKPSPSPVECEICHQVFKNKYTLKTHMKNRHTPNRETYECPHCGKKLLNKYYLSTHIKRIHSDELKIAQLKARLEAEQAKSSESSDPANDNDNETQ